MAAFHTEFANRCLFFRLSLRAANKRLLFARCPLYNAMGGGGRVDIAAELGRHSPANRRHRGTSHNHQSTEWLARWTQAFVVRVLRVRFYNE